MIEIKYNQNVITRLKEAGFFPDTMFAEVYVMQALANGDYATLDVLDDYSQSKRMAVLYYDLVRRRLLIENPSDEKFIYSLSPDGVALLESLQDLSLNVVKDDTHEWIQEWIELFPKGVKSGGKLLRSDAKSCLIKMKKFRKDYKEYTKEQIFAATADYLNERAREDYQFTKCAVYFIHKQGEGSSLAERCVDLFNTDNPVSINEDSSSVLDTRYTGLV